MRLSDDARPSHARAIVTLPFGQYAEGDTHDSVSLTTTPPASKRMSSLSRTLVGDALVQHLPVDALSIDLSLVTKHGRSARTLVKQGPMRLTLMELAPGGQLPPHSADGPVSIHVLKGYVTFTAAERDYPLAVGDVLVLAGAVEHSAQTENGVLFLLTIVQTE